VVRPKLPSLNATHLYPCAFAYSLKVPLFNLLIEGLGSFQGN